MDSPVSVPEKGLLKRKGLSLGHAACFVFGHANERIVSDCTY